MYCSCIFFANPVRIVPYVRIQRTGITVLEQDELLDFSSQPISLLQLLCRYLQWPRSFHNVINEYIM